MLFGARGQLPTLGVQLRKAAGDVLHTGMQHAVLVVLRVEIILVALPLVGGHQCCVLPAKGRKVMKKWQQAKFSFQISIQNQHCSMNTLSKHLF